ncbi:MAG: nitrous oxide reductase family maturation protein NosD [Anaerolineales bacterium]|nr:nitrous oxide reductase family maturation protein NosD [Anaerolineales bacterium]
MIKRLWLVVLIGLIMGGAVSAETTSTLSAADLRAALDAAEAGDTLEIHGGVYDGPLTIDKPITLIGVDWPVVDGGDLGTVIQITAPHVTLRGFVVRHSGQVLDQENAGIAVESPDALIENNRLEETLFGIYLRQADRTILRNNQISSKDLAVQRRGDPIRVWYSNDVIIESNTVIRGRDVVLWYSERLTVRGNSISHGRYGLHFMYCDDALIERNSLLDNSVGAFLMYSRRMTMRHNTVARNRGPSGYGIGLKDMDDAVVQNNLFLDNRVGAYVDGSPREVDSIGQIAGNLFAYNDIGIELLPAVRHNDISDNSFVENEEQVSITGGGSLVNANNWTVGNTGNYWSDYAGYDADGDLRGDFPYQSDRLFESMTARRPELRLFLYSPATAALDFASRAFPIVKPQPKLVDTHPLLAPSIPDAPPLPKVAATGWVLTTGGLLLGALTLISLTQVKVARRQKRTRPGERSAAPTDVMMITIDHLTKRFGNLTAVNDLSVTIRSGEAVAFWGANGAGKTTALHCLLNLIPFEGAITVGGLNVARQGKAVRRLIGFVPQELTFHDDMTVRETVAFYAALKKVVVDSRTENLLERLALQPHRDKCVGDLSGGLKQRLALALALLADPPLLILDEPTANLDIRAREDFLALLLQLKHAGKTLVFSSHRLEEVTALADRVLLLEGGELVVDAPPHEIGQRIGRMATLHLYLPPDGIEAAAQLLTQHGLTVSANGRGIRVQVAPQRKGLTLRMLHEAGVIVNDFVVE